MVNINTFNIPFLLNIYKTTFSSAEDKKEHEIVNTKTATIYDILFLKYIKFTLTFGDKILLKKFDRRTKGLRNNMKLSFNKGAS